MFYKYFWIPSWIFNIFGIIKPLVSRDGKPRATSVWFKLWSLLTAFAILTTYIMSNGNIQFSLKNNLEQLSDINDLATNVGIILINLMNRETSCISLYETLDKVFEKIRFNHTIIKLFAFKMYFWFCIPTLSFVTLIILEFVNNRPPFILLIRIPTFLSALHLFMHLYLILASLKIVNDKLSSTFKYYDSSDYYEKLSNKRILAYFLSPDIRFIKLNNEHVELKILCEIYDELTTCNQLLEKHHGLQILLSIWHMFSCAVAGVTLIVCDQAKIKWLVIVKTMLPLIWTFVGCYIDDQLQKEVDQTNTVLIKHQIDYRCDQIKKLTLNTFKQLVSTNRLQFTICSIFNLNYSMILGTILNVITYSIILIQLLLSE